MGVQYKVQKTFDAVHERGTKFYQIITVVRIDGARHDTKVIGHYGPIRHHSPRRFAGSKKFYGGARSEVALAQEKRKTGYINDRIETPEHIGLFNTEREVIEKLESIGLDMSSGDRYAMGFTLDANGMAPEADHAPVTEARSAVDAIATTREENVWAGTW